MKNSTKLPIEMRKKPPHRMYCGKSGMSCAVYHVGKPCPDVTDCEACKWEDEITNKVDTLI